MSINPLKAEKILNFPNNVEYKTRMSLDTIMKIEEKLGTSLIQVANKLSQGGILLTEIVIILTYAIRAGGNDVKENDIKELVSEIGYVESIKVTGQLLTNALKVDDAVVDEKKN